MDLTEAVRGLIERASTQLPPDVLRLLEGARGDEKGAGAAALDDILENADIARREARPMCQDTGALNFFVRKGGHSEDELGEAITEAVEAATSEGLLRPNSVDPVSGKSLGNLPAAHFEEGDFEVKLLLKGGGSENVSAQYKLPDASLEAGRDMGGVEKCISDAVFRAQGKGCPPYVLGACIGGQRESGYLGAKKQLFRKMGERGELAGLETRLKGKLNGLGIGPMGLGGKSTVLEVFATTLPRLPACYFVSVSINCWALRRWTLTIKDGKPHYS